MTQTQELPAQLVTPQGVDTETWESQLKAMFPDITKGKKAEIPQALADAYAYAQMMKAEADAQLRIALCQIRSIIGDAQHATVNGVPVLSRRVYDREEYIMPETHVDAFWPAGKKQH